MTAAIRLAGAGARIPLTVIGGFLGAGKTTLLNRMLGQVHGLRMAVLVNDFGAVNIDAALVASRSADTISLTNGCVCCQIGDALGDALARLIEAEAPPQWIVIEASGVSDPWRIAQVGLADPALALDGVVVMADAGAIREHAADPRVADVIVGQLRAADVVVLNKMDGRAPDPELDAWVASHAGRAPLFHASHAEVPLGLLTGLALQGTGPGTAGKLACTHDTCACEAAGGGMVDHGERFDSVRLDASGKVYDADALRLLLRDLPRGVLRLKGVLDTGRLGAAELQFAGKRGSLRRHAGGAAVRALVAIGLRGALPRDALAARLRACEAGAGTTDTGALALPGACAQA